MLAETLINGDTLNGTIQIGRQSGTPITLGTSQKYIQKNIVLNISAKPAAPSFDGGALNSKSASATFTNATTSATNTSGVAIQTKGTAGRDAVLYNGAVEGWVSKTDNATASAAIASSEWNGTTYYLTGITLGNSKTFDITVPNGTSNPVTFRFTVDASGNTTVTSVE